MKYFIKCVLTDESIKNLKYYEHKTLQKYKHIKNKNMFHIPIIDFKCENNFKLNTSIVKQIQKLQIFRVNIFDTKIHNKFSYLLIKPFGFVSMIQRLFEEELSLDNIKYNKLNKWNFFYIEYLNLNNNKINLNLDDIFFPPYVKISSVDIIKLNNKKNSLIESIKLKNI